MTTLNALQAGVPLHADATNHRHSSQNHSLERKSHGRMIQDSAWGGFVPKLVRAGPLCVEATFQHTAYPVGLALVAVTI